MRCGMRVALRDGGENNEPHRCAAKGQGNVRRKAAFIEQMECALVSNLLEGPDWTYKVKLEGYRAVAVKSGRGVNLFSRRRKSLNHQYPYLVKALGLPCLCQGCPPAQPRFLVTQEWSVFCRCKSEDLPDCRTFGPPYSFPRLIGPAERRIGPHTRGFEPGEDVGSNAHPVTVISYQLWQSRFKGDPTIIGKTQRLNGIEHTIVGVAPGGFLGTFVGWGIQFWVPASMEETFEGGGYKLEDRGARWIEAYVRLKPGVTLEQAQQEISAVAKRLETDFPATNRGRGIKLWPLWQTPFNNAGTLLPTLGIMLAVVVFVLLIACANVGNLLLVRSFSRRHEMTVRLAIGAGRGRLLKQLFTEGLILSAFGAAGGLLVAHWCRHALVLLFPARGGVAMHLPGEIDWRVLALSAGVCLLATLLLGLVPAMQTSKIDLAGALKSDSAGVVGGGGRAWVRSGLVVVQVSLSFVLLVGAGLLLQSLQRIRTMSPGFSTHGVLDTSVPLVAAGYDAPRAQSFQDELLNRVKALPGVESAAFGRMTPLGYGSFSSTAIAVDGYQPPPEE